jgi:taurine dioxygenase
MLRVLFRRHRLLLFREQILSADDQLALCRALGPVVDPVAWVSNVEAGFHREGELLFHSDYAFTPSPMLGLSLYAVELDGDAAPTEFASSEHAVADLPPELRERVAGLSVTHVIDAVSGRDNLRTRLDDVGGSEAPTDRYPRFTRPALWNHPVDGAPLLYVTEQQASHFAGWSCDASEGLLSEIFAVLYDEGNRYAHDWAPGDLVVWDNLALQHGRPANPNAVRRSLRRVAMHTVSTADLIAGTGFDPEWRRAHAAGA